MFNLPSLTRRLSSCIVFVKNYFYRLRSNICLHQNILQSIQKTRKKTEWKHNRIAFLHSIFPPLSFVYIMDFLLRLHFPLLHP